MATATTRAEATARRISASLRIVPLLSPTAGRVAVCGWPSLSPRIRPTLRSGSTDVPFAMGAGRRKAARIARDNFLAPALRLRRDVLRRRRHADAAHRRRRGAARSHGYAWV